MRRLLALTGALCAAAVAPAQAADHEFTLSTATPVHAWAGAPDFTRGSLLNDPGTRNQIPCDTPGVRPCEEVLIRVAEPGKFIANLKAQDAGVPLTTDVDAYLYESDAAGARGRELAGANADGPDSIAQPKAAPGFYLLVVDYYSAYNTGYEATLKFTPDAPPVPAAPAVPAVPKVTTPAPKAKRKPSCAGRAKRIKNRRKRTAALRKCRRAAGKKR